MTPEGERHVRYRTEFTDGARLDLRYLRSHEQGIIVAAIEAQLVWEPGKETRNRKLLRLNPLADWEMRAGNHRVFYDVLADTQTVAIKAIGWKEHNALFIRGKEYHL